MTRIPLVTCFVMAALAAPLAVQPAAAQPAAGSAQPAAGSAQPAAGSAQPAAGPAQPAAGSARPAPGGGLPGAGPAEGPGPVARMTPPASWTPDEGRGAGILKSLASEAHFGGVAVGLDAQYLRSPMPGALLISTQVVTEALPADPTMAATAELYAARDGADAVDGATVVRWEVLLDPAMRVHQAVLEWTDASVGTTVLSRTLVFRTNDVLARVSAECILGPDATGLRPVCETALASLTANEPGLQPLTLMERAPTNPVGAGASAGSGSSAGSGPRLSAPTIGERDAALPSTIMVTKPPPKAQDRRPLYVIGGLVLLGLVFWWNRRSRREVDAANEAAARTVGRRAQDDDADAKDDEDAKDDAKGDDDAQGDDAKGADAKGDDDAQGDDAKDAGAAKDAPSKSAAKARAAKDGAVDADAAKDEEKPS